MPPKYSHLIIRDPYEIQQRKHRNRPHNRPPQPQIHSNRHDPQPKPESNHLRHNPSTAQRKPNQQQPHPFIIIGKYHVIQRNQS